MNCYADFRLVSKSVTLNDLERRNEPQTRATSAVAELIVTF